MEPSIEQETEWASAGLGVVAKGEIPAPVGNRVLFVHPVGSHSQGFSYPVSQKRDKPFSGYPFPG
jgi:hypothetical protein